MNKTDINTYSNNFVVAILNGLDVVLGTSFRLPRINADEFDRDLAICLAQDMEVEDAVNYMARLWLEPEDRL